MNNTGRSPVESWGERPGEEHPGLAGLLGHWRGSTHLAAGPWGPERTVDAEVTYKRLAGGVAVVQSYRHREADGTHFDGHGVFTVDPDHRDVLWYRVDGPGGEPGVPARCTWHDGALRVERHGDAGWTRHTLRVDNDVLTHVTELRVRAGGEGAAHGPGDADGTGSAYRPFMTSTFRRS